MKKMSAVVLALLMWLIGSIGYAETISILLVDLRLMDHDKAAIARFERDHPGVKVELRISTGDYAEQVYANYAGGTMPDIITRDLGAPPLIDLYEAGIIIDHTKLIEKNKQHFAGWYPGLLDLARVRGVIMAVPRTQVQPYVFFYNQDHFENAGVGTPNGNWSWTEFRNIGRRLTRDIDGNGQIDVFAWDKSWYHWQPWLRNRGVKIVDLDAWTTDLNSQASVETLQFLRDLRFSDNVMPHPSYRWGDSRKAFTSDRLSIIERQPHFANEIPDSIRAGVVLEPKAPGSSVRYSMMTMQGLSIASTCKNPELAFELIKYLTDEQSAMETVRDTGALVAIRSVNDRYFGRNVNVRNFRNVFAAALEQPQFMAYHGVSSKTWSLVEQLINSAIEADNEPVASVAERLVPLIKRSLLEERVSRRTK